MGYGGTKTEMQRLIDDANRVREANGEMANLSIESFADIVVAIETMQDKMGISETTAREAGTTIEGSVNAMKSAWTNLVTGFADGSADIGGLINNLVTTIAGDGTKSNLGVIGNVLPAVERALGGVVQLIGGAAPHIINLMPKLIDEIVPSVISAATDIVNVVIDVLPSLLDTVVSALSKNAPKLITAAIQLVQSMMDGISDNYQILADAAVGIIVQLTAGVLNMLPKIIELGLDLIVSLANGIAASLPELIPTIIGVMMQIVDTLTEPKTLSNLLDAALVLITELAYGLMDAIPALIDATLEIVESLVEFLLKPENIAKLVFAALEIVLAIGTGLVSAIPRLITSVTELLLSIANVFTTQDWGKIGSDVVSGFLNGLKKSWESVKYWFSNAVNNLVSGVKNILGINSPSKVFKKIGGFTAEGFGVGFEDEFAHVRDDMEKALTFDDASIGINASIKKVGVGQDSFGGNVGGVYIVQNIYSEAKTAADLMQEALYQQERAVLLGV